MRDDTKKLRERLAHEVQVGCLHHRFQDVGEILLALVDHIGKQDERIAELERTKHAFGSVYGTKSADGDK